MRIRTAITLVVFIGLRWVSPASAQIEVLLTEGDAYFASFDNAAALRSYEAARSRAPEDFEVLYRLARTYNDYGWDFAMAGEATPARRELEKGVAAAEELIARYPDRAESWFMMAATRGNLALFKGGKEKVHTGRAVEEYCLRALQIDPSYALPHLALGIFYREVGRLNWVQRTLASALFGGLPEGSADLAVSHFEQALARDTDLPAAHYELAVTLAELGRNAEATPHFDAAANLPARNTQDVRNATDARSRNGGNR